MSSGGLHYVPASHSGQGLGFGLLAHGLAFTPASYLMILACAWSDLLTSVERFSHIPHQLLDGPGPANSSAPDFQPGVASCPRAHFLSSKLLRVSTFPWSATPTRLCCFPSCCLCSSLSDHCLAGILAIATHVVASRRVSLT